MNPPAPAITTAPHTRGPRAEGAPVVSIRGIHKSFGELQVLAGVDLEFERGKITVILGPSGTGKSVLLKHMIGLLQPDQGEVYFNDTRVDTLGEKELVDVRRRVGYLFQLGALFDSMTIEENIAFPLVEHTNDRPSQRAERVKQVLELVGLDGVQQKMPAELSGGQQRRVALARAVVLRPELVLYDEPTTGLDPVRADVINELILALARHMGISSIVVTHDMASANKIADRMILMGRGRVVCDAPPQAFRDSDLPMVQRFIHGQADQEDLDAIRRAFAHVGAGPEETVAKP
ncbi:MAG: ABC transporter ATP-binding protein [Planctomycetota bacterium]